MYLSIIIPAYNASIHIGKALASVYCGVDKHVLSKIEVIVVNDGSDDVEQLEKVCSQFHGVRLCHHQRNLGMCAARNTGIFSSHGKYVTLLDADDEFVSDWYSVFETIVAEWPAQAQVCYTPCINDKGEITCSMTGYRGWLTAEEIVLGNLTGEYNPIFRGDYIRDIGYKDIGTRKSCGLLSYLQMARDAPFWVTDKVMRRYHDSGEQSITYGWMYPEKAAETLFCYSKVMEEHGDFIRCVSVKRFLQMKQKMLVYRMLSRKGRGLDQWWKNRYMGISWFATLGLLLLGPSISARLLGFAKRANLIRRYG